MPELRGQRRLAGVEVGVAGVAFLRCRPTGVDIEGNGEG
jgi:hypothetical protein